MGSCPNNIPSETYNKKTKTRTKPNDRLDKLVHHLEEEDEYEMEKQEIIIKNLRNVEPSEAQEKVKASHPKMEDSDDYTIVDRKYGTFLIFNNKRNKKKEYILSRNPFKVCNRDLCLVKCSKCPPGFGCTHLWVCECQDCQYHNICKHIHMLILYFEREGKVVPVLDKDRSRQEDPNDEPDQAQVLNEEDNDQPAVIPNEEEALADNQSGEINLQEDDHALIHQNEEDASLINIEGEESSDSMIDHNQNFQSSENVSTKVPDKAGQDYLEKKTKKEKVVSTATKRGKVDHAYLDSTDYKQKCIEKKLRIAELIKEVRMKSESSQEDKEHFEKLEQLELALVAALHIANTTSNKPVRERSNKPIRSVMDHAAKSKKRTPQKVKSDQPSSKDFHRKTLIDMLLFSMPNNPDWPMILNQDMGTILERINEKPDNEQGEFRQRVEAALDHWNCATCQKKCDQVGDEVIERGFVVCNNCQNRFHNYCVGREVTKTKYIFHFH